MSNVKYPILSLDLGDRYIGTAFSEAGILVSAGEMVDRKEKSDEQIFSQLSDLIRSKEIQTLVVGLPINEDGSENERCHIIRGFILRLDAHIGASLPIVYFPEDFSSIEAKHQISQKYKLNQKQPQDHSIAAKIILERFIEEQKN